MGSGKLLHMRCSHWGPVTHCCSRKCQARGQWPVIVLRVWLLAICLSAATVWNCKIIWLIYTDGLSILMIKDRYSAFACLWVYYKAWNDVKQFWPIVILNHFQVRMEYGSNANQCDASVKAGMPHLFFLRSIDIKQWQWQCMCITLELYYCITNRTKVL